MRQWAESSAIPSLPPGPSWLSKMACHWPASLQGGRDAIIGPAGTGAIAAAQRVLWRSQGTDYGPGLCSTSGRHWTPALWWRSLEP